MALRELGWTTFCHCSVCVVSGMTFSPLAANVIITTFNKSNLSTAFFLLIHNNNESHYNRAESATCCNTTPTHDLTRVRYRVDVHSFPVFDSS